MEINRNHRHLCLLDYLEHRRLPRPVGDDTILVGHPYRTGREEPYRLTLLEHLYGLAHTCHGYTPFLRIIGCRLVDGNEIRTHGREFIEYHVDHDLVFRPHLSDYIYQGDTVNGAEGMIADRDEGPLLETPEDIHPLHFKTDVEFIHHQMLHESRARILAPGSVDTVDLIDLEQMEKFFYQPWIVRRLRNEIRHVSHIDNIGPHLYARVFIEYHHFLSLSIQLPLHHLLLIY